MITSAIVAPLRLTKTLVVAAAFIVLPFSMTHAQDFKAIEKRLSAAIEKGEINAGQARVMLETLRKNSNRDPQARKKQEDIDHRISEVKKLVESGKISKQKGVQLIKETQAALKDSSNRDQDRKLAGKKRQYEELETKIRAALKAGDISYEEAEKKLIAVRTKFFGKRVSNGKKPTDAREDTKYRIHEIEKLVKEGKLSREDAAIKIRYMKQATEGKTSRLAEDQKRLDAIEYRLKKIEDLVSSRKLSPEKGDRLTKKPRGSSKDKSGDDARKARYTQIQRDIEAALKAGKLSREEAEKKLIRARQAIFSE